MKKVVIDTDPGVDDCLAIAMACYSNLNIVGLTTVYGNSSIENSTRNALTIMQLLKKNIPVFKGAAKPIIGEGINANSQGSNGLGGYKIKTLNKVVSAQSALIYLKELLEKSGYKTITIVCIGPTTNLGILKSLYPHLCDKLKEIVILGGVFGQIGNISKYAEFNTYNDPISLKSILTIDCKKTIIPINMCRKIIFTKRDLNNVKNLGLRKIFKKITDIYIKYYTSGNQYGRFGGGVMYDLLAIAYLIDKKLFKTELGYVDVCVNSESRYAETRFVSKKLPNCNIVSEVKTNKIKELFFNKINS